MEASTLVSVALGGLVLWQVTRAMTGKVAPEKARALVEGGAKLVDVRSPVEHAAAHIAGSVNVPVSELAARAGELGDKSKPVVVYCASGMRSASAKATLRRAGFTDVYDLGSISRWI